MWKGIHCKYVWWYAPLKRNALSVLGDMSAFLHGFAFNQPRSTMRAGVFHAIKDLSSATVLCFATDAFLQWMTAIAIKGIVFSADPVI